VQTLESPTLRGRRQAERTRTRRRNLLTLATVLVLLTPLAIGSVWVLANVPRSSTTPPDVVLQVQPGWGMKEVAQALVAHKVIPSAASFEQVASDSKFTTYVAGRYVFFEGSDARTALDTLRGGPATIVPDASLLLRPGLTMGQIADRVGKLPGKSAARFAELAGSNVVRSRYEPANVTSLEGLTWPDTYSIGATETETHMLQRFVGRFDNQADALGLGNAGALGISPYQTLVVASLIEAEAGSAADAPLISAVIYNRLKAKMPLQLDSTLCYAKGGCNGGPLASDRQINSPYNTFLALGLPPTPIRTPSTVSIKAALNPAAVSYLYFVSDKNGKTYYATTLAEQEANAAKARSVK
jgi:UPF0755 protein